MCKKVAQVQLRCVGQGCGGDFWGDPGCWSGIFRGKLSFNQCKQLIFKVRLIASLAVGCGSAILACLPDGVILHCHLRFSVGILLVCWSRRLCYGVSVWGSVLAVGCVVWRILWGAAAGVGRDPGGCMEGAWARGSARTLHAACVRKSL